MEWGLTFLPSPNTIQYILGLYFLFSKENPSWTLLGHHRVSIG